MLRNNSNASTRAVVSIAWEVNRSREKCKDWERIYTLPGAAQQSNTAFEAGTVVMTKPGGGSGESDEAVTLKGDEVVEADT